MNSNPISTQRDEVCPLGQALSFADFDRSNDVHLQRFLDFRNDPDLAPLFVRNGKPEPLETAWSLESYRRHLASLPATDRNGTELAILHEGEVIGFMGLIMDPPFLETAQPGTAWLHIVIGSSSHRGRGLGTRLVSVLEERARTQGAHRIECGIFEYNIASLHLWRKLGYREIARRPQCTYWAGRWWDEIRMLKELSPAAETPQAG